MGRPRETLESKFWSKVKKGRSLDDCWEWTASKFKAGYGQLTHGYAEGEHKNLKGHRVSYEIHFGAIPDGMLVCHRCDEPSCANPRHLYLGTWQDNVQDMIVKGRRYDTSGANNGQAKITAKIAEQIRKEYAKNDPTFNRYQRRKWSQAKLGAKYGITQTVVSNIVNGNYWKNA